mmetsp:Transcript_84210/g.140671  ORF Transcript_84210/g.140671 Transcript_84210/m.140671 type:complete len:95 (+) Transcript_84210:1620-1904(+)
MTRRGGGGNTHRDGMCRPVCSTAVGPEQSGLQGQKRYTSSHAQRRTIFLEWTCKTYQCFGNDKTTSAPAEVCNVEFVDMKKHRKQHFTNLQTIP